MRDRTLEDTIYVYFNSRALDATPTTLLGTPAVAAYEDGSITQITAGLTLTVDHDGVTGRNLITVAATAANGYESGKEYTLVLTAGTVGGTPVVGEEAGCFSLGRDAATVAVGLLNDISATQVNAECDAALADYDGPTNAEMVARTLAAADYFDPATDAVANVTNLTNLPSIPANWITAAGISAAALNGKGDWNIGKTGYSLTQTFPANFSDFAIDATVGTVTLKNGTHTGAVIPTVSTLSGHTPQTADHTANIAAILTDTGTTLDGKLNAIQGGTFNTATDSLEAIRDRGDAAWTTGAGGTPPQLLQSTTIATLATQTSFTLTAGSADNDAYNGAVIVFTDAATSTQKAVGEVSDYVGATKTVTLTADPGIFTIAAGDTVEIIAALGAAGSGASAADVWSYATRVLTAGTNLNDIAATDIVTGGPIATAGGAVSNVTTTANNTDMRGTDNAALATALTTAQNDLDKITGADGATLATAQGLYAPAKASDVTSLLTTQMVESYAADGVAPTLAQALMLIQQKVGNFAIAGTTLTVKKLDGTTAAATYTLDSATAPTSTTRAT